MKLEGTPQGSSIALPKFCVNSHRPVKNLERYFKFCLSFSGGSDPPNRSCSVTLLSLVMKRAVEP